MPAMLQQQLLLLILSSFQRQQHLDKNAKKPKRDPNEPRRNLTSYVLFSNYIRPIIKERIQGISFIDLSKQMGLEFRQLSPEDREIWNGKAKEDKTRYELAMEEYRKTGAVANQNKQTPKKGKSSYNLYFQAMHDKMKTEHPELTFGELSKKMGQEFKSLPQDERKNWEELAKEDRKRALESSIEASALSSSTSSSRPNKPPPQKRSRKEKRDPNLPKKNLTSYIYFSNSIREEMKTNCPEATFCELGKLMGIEFKKLNQEQRDVFNVLAAKDKLRYDGAMVEYEAKKKKEQEIVKAEAVVVAEAAAVVVAEIVESKGDESGDESPVQAVVEC